MNYLTTYRRLGRENPIRAAARNTIRSIRSIGYALGRMKTIYKHPLNAETPAAAVFNYSALKLRQKLTGATMIPYVGGAKLLWPKGAGSVAIQAKYGLGEIYDQAFCLHLLRRGDLFCDLGANAGVYTVLASKVIGSHSIAVEPVPRTFDLLRRNIEINDISGLVETHQCGVGRDAGRLRFTSALWSFNRVATAHDTDTVEVPVRPLDEILNGRVPRVIKIDVEGFEAEVIAGALHTLAQQNCKAVILELVAALERYGTTHDRVARQMREIGFTPYWYHPSSRSLGEVGRWRQFRYNQIFIRDLEFVKKRLASAPAFEVRGVRL